MITDANGALHDDAGRFARSRISRVLDRAREVTVTASTTRSEGDRRGELAEMSDADVKALLAAARPDYSADDVRVTDRARAERMILRAEITAGSVRRDATEEELERIEADRERGERERHNARAVLDYLHSDHPDVSGGARQLPSDVRMVPIEELFNRLTGGADGFIFDRELARRAGELTGWEHIVDRQLGNDGTDEWIAGIVKSGMQPIQVNPEMTNINNGHHRLAMAILMGIRAVPVSTRDYEAEGGGGHFAVPLR